MKLLLDTHCLIWLLTDAPQLDTVARQTVGDAESVWFSDASIWELGLKWRKGKIALQPRRIAEQALTNGLRPLAIQLEAVLLSCELRQSHADPFDRLLYAQARHGDYRLMSIDRGLAAFGAVVLKPK
ncbi:MAG: type II toxin-antitoxin system VapC family toxin [Gammaproteobacteria bacterium]